MPCLRPAACPDLPPPPTCPLLQPLGAGASPGRGEVTVNPVDLDGRYQSADYYTHTDATRAFDQEWQETKARQDQQLDNIETGLGTLKEIGSAMNEELQRHDILIQEVDEKMDKVTKELQTNNMRLKGMVTKVRGWRGCGPGLLLRCVAGGCVCVFVVLKMGWMELGGGMLRGLACVEVWRAAQPLSRPPSPNSELHSHGMHYPLPTSHLCPPRPPLPFALPADADALHPQLCG